MLEPPDDPVLCFTRGLPRRALALDVQGQGPGGLGGRKRFLRKVLLLGDLVASVSRALQARGVLFTKVSGPAAAMGALAKSDFDMVIVEEEGLELIRAVKLGERMFEISRELQSEAMRRHPITPMLVLPVDGDTEYAVIIHPPAVAFLENGRNVPLNDAILRLDVKKLLLAGGAIA